MAKKAPIQPLKVDFDKSANPVFGKKLPLFQHTDIKSADDLLRDAHKVNKFLPDIARALIAKANGDLPPTQNTHIKISDFKQAEMKKVSRINEKAKGDYNGNFYNIRDVCRGGIYLDDNTKIAALSAVLDWAKDYEVDLPHGARIVISDNRFKSATSTGHRSHKVNIAIPVPSENGSEPTRYHIAELMLYHKDFERQISADHKNSFGMNSHEVYEKVRSMLARASERSLTTAEANRLGQFIRTCRNIHDKARDKYNLNEIPKLLSKFNSIRGRETWAAMDIGARGPDHSLP
jgi:hypothetical protein